ncbi:MFS transporter [Cohnella lubricantis]|uniref:MFS transporter n=1 Tax=Cohnella lubricantis TaxID=2163172 RepID=A0A841T657_9BACL|nr:MFS transporter [Cohnella lubricantis]MBB6677023.1 MFS transporter [Cohnella lubricantis]MBP2119310.1 CP family cyanate transporter-like MFS transporter [Cohnella lubricantis]
MNKMNKWASLFTGLALFLASLNLRPAINAVSPILQTIRYDLGMNAFVASLLTSIPVLCMGLFSPIAVQFGRRYGIERMIGISLAIIGAGNALRLIAHSTFLLLVTAFVAGVGIAMIGPLLSGFIKHRFPSHVPTMISLYTIALALGATAASGSAIPLQSRLHSWQGSLSLWATLSFFALLTWRIAVLRGAPRSNVSVVSNAKLPWGNAKAWMLTLSFGMLAMLFFSLTAWLPPVIHGMGYSTPYAANLLTLFSLIQIPVSLVLPKLLKRIPSRVLWLLTGSSFFLAGFVLLGTGRLPWFAVILLGIAPGILFPLNLMLPIDEAEGAPEAAAWSAMTQSIGYTTGALGPILLGWLYDATGGSYPMLVTGMVFISVIMICCQLRIFYQRRPSLE